VLAATTSTAAGRYRQRTRRAKAPAMVEAAFCAVVTKAY
jgi:hypothetical protein